MNTQFRSRWLLYINSQKANKGFTLIELLVVIIIIGVLSAIAMGNVLGQVAKGRQAEAKNHLGAINRAIQGYRLEYAMLPTALDNLSIKVTEKYYNFDYDTLSGFGNTTAIAQDTYEDDILDYAGGVLLTNTAFHQIICEEQYLNSSSNTTDSSNNEANNIAANMFIYDSGGRLMCDGSREIK